MGLQMVGPDSFETEDVSKQRPRYFYSELHVVGNGTGGTLKHINSFRDILSNGQDGVCAC